MLYIRYLKVKSIEKFAGILLSIFMTGLLCVAQTDSLSHYLTLAANNNPEVLQNYIEYRAALEKIPQAAALQDPQVDLGIFLTPMELIGGKQVAEFRLMQMFPWFGTLRSAKDEMSYMANAKYENLRDSKLQVYYDVQKTWFELYKLKQDIRISERNVEILLAIERLATVRFTLAPTGGGGKQDASANNTVRSGPALNNDNAMQGMGNSQRGTSANQASPVQANSMQDNLMSSPGSDIGLSDVYRIQMEIGEIRNSLALLKDNQNVVRARFNSFLNRPVQTPVFVPDTILPDTLSFSLNSIHDSMMTNNPMLEMLEYEKKSLQSKKKMVTRMGYPMVGLGLNYSIIGKNEMSDSEMNGEDMIMPMMSVTLPVYRKKYRAMQNEAELMIESVTLQQVTASNNLMTEYYEAMRLFEDSKRRIRLYANQGILVKSSLRILIQEFTATAGGLTEILRLRQQALDYDYKYAEAVADFHVSVAWLKRLGASDNFENMQSGQ